jgi:hypothetical protein
MPDHKRYWRLPTDISPILTYLLYSVVNRLQSDVEEVKLAIELHALLILSSQDEGHLSGPFNGGGNPDFGRKRGRDEDEDDSKKPKERRVNPPRAGKGRGRGSGRTGE